MQKDEWGVLKLGSITWCEYDPSENKALLPVVCHDPELEVKAGDLLFSRKNTYELVAACAFVYETPPRLQVRDLIFRFRLKPDAGLDPIYCQSLLVHPTKRRDVQKLASGSSGSMPNISKGRLEKLLIEVPPLSLQRHFAERVKATRKLVACQKRALTRLDALFASLQRRAFHGEL